MHRHEVLSYDQDGWYKGYGTDEVEEMVSQHTPGEEPDFVVRFGYEWQVAGRCCMWTGVVYQTWKRIG